MRRSKAPRRDICGQADRGAVGLCSVGHCRQRLRDARSAGVFAIGLAVGTFAVIELMGPGIGNVLGTYRGVPLLIFVMTGVVVGQMRDLRTEIESELAQRRKVEHEFPA